MKRCNQCSLYLFSGDFYTNNSACKSCSLSVKRSAHIKDPRHQMLIDARKRSKKKNLPFHISIEDIDVPDVCPVLGITLEIGLDDRDTSPSLDRLDPSKGYVKGNVNVISYRANTLKNNATSEELLKVVKWMQANDGSCSISHDYSQP